MKSNPYSQILLSSKTSYFLKILAIIIGISINGLSSAADKVQEVINTGVKRSEQASQSQEKIDKISDQTDDIVGEYKTVTKIVEGLNVYNKLLQKQLDAQQAEINQLNYSIDQVSVIERQITPLMLRMLDGLEQFIELDVPFLQKNSGLY
jgi:methyl-accepting chemotaxis protein